MMIVILCAMQAEADALIAALDLAKTGLPGPLALPFHLYQSTDPMAPVSLLCSGRDTRHDVDWIGMEAATLMAYYAIRELSATLLISAGTAGGFRRHGLQIGQVCVSDGYFFCHDHHVPLPGFERSSEGRFPSADVRTLADKLHLQYGPMSSGSSLVNNPRDLQQLEDWGVIAKEMEVAAEAFVAYLANTPIFAVKAITNLIDDERSSSAEQFMANFEKATQALAQIMPTIINQLSDQTAIGLER